MKRFFLIIYILLNFSFVLFSHELDGNMPDEVFVFLDEIEQMIDFSKIDYDNIRLVLEQQSLRYDNISYIYIAFEDKKIILSKESSLPGNYDPTTRPWYKADEKYIATYTAYDGKTFGTYSKTIYNAKFDKIGVLAIDIEL